MGSANFTLLAKMHAYGIFLLDKNPQPDLHGIIENANFLTS